MKGLPALNRLDNALIKLEVLFYSGSSGLDISIGLSVCHDL